jgi:hypothetical protein
MVHVWRLVLVKIRLKLAILSEVFEFFRFLKQFVNLSALQSRREELLRGRLLTCGMAGDPMLDSPGVLS